MAEVILMPRMSDTMEEGNIVGWLKAVGDEVEPGDVLAEVETDKATMELESFHEGVLLYIGIKEGPVPVNGVLAVIGEKGEDYKSALADAQAIAAGNEASSGPPEPPKSTESIEVVETVVAQNTEHNLNDTRVKASPLAKSMAAEAGINLNNITGSGDHGRIVKRDIEAAMNGKGQSNSTPAVQPATPVAKESAKTPVVAPFVFNGSDNNFEDVPVSQMRKVIARRLGESKFAAPHFYLTVDINMDKAKVARERINEISPTRISYNDFVIKACAVALRQHPAINASWLGDKIRYNKNINVGVAVAVPDGLLVPVVKHADMKSLSQIDAEVRTMAGKAKEKKLQPEEMQGNTFTISNLGMFGIEEFTAIINPPDSCIMAVGAIIEKAIVKDGALAVGNMMKVTLSCDHRVVDGATGAKFLQTVKDVLEDPIRLLV